jgi:hypothetical protein
LLTGRALLLKSLTASCSALWKKKSLMFKPLPFSPPSSLLAMTKSLAQKTLLLPLPPRSPFLLFPLSSRIEDPQGLQARKEKPLRIQRVLFALSGPPLSLQSLPVPPGAGTREPPALLLTSPAPSHCIAAPPYSPNILSPVLAAISPLREVSFEKRWRLLCLVFLMLAVAMPHMMGQEKELKAELSTLPFTTWSALLLGCQLSTLDVSLSMQSKLHLDMSPDIKI